VNRAPIFYETDNYSYLTQGMYRFLPHYKVELVAYCLTPNHYHILLEELEGKQASRFIQRVFNLYTQAMNKRYSRVGTLFQGSAKHTEFLSSEDTATVIGYIHQNPVAAGLVKHPSEWMFSDYNEWAGKTGSARKVVKYRENLFGSLVDYEEFVENETLKRFFQPFQGLIRSEDK
jgi:REP element-mobilizing transposase RayT